MTTFEWDISGQEKTFELEIAGQNNYSAEAILAPAPLTVEPISVIPLAPTTLAVSTTKALPITKTLTMSPLQETAARIAPVSEPTTLPLPPPPPSPPPTQTIIQVVPESVMQRAAQTSSGGGGGYGGFGSPEATPPETDSDNLKEDMAKETAVAPAKGKKNYVFIGIVLAIIGLAFVFRKKI